MIRLRPVRMRYPDNPVERMTRWVPRVSASGTTTSVADAHFKGLVFATYSATEEVVWAAQRMRRISLRAPT